MSKALFTTVAMLVALAAVLTACAAPTPTPAAPTPVVIEKEVIKEVTKEIVKEVLVEKPPQSLTIYSGRSETLIDPIIRQFSQASGVKVSVKYAGTPQLAATLQEEADRTLADVFFAQDPGGLGAVDKVLVRLPDDILGRVLDWARPPDGKWVGISGRARVVVYNTRRLTAADQPDSILDFSDPKWKGRIGWPPTNASFQTMVTAMRVMWEEDKARQWLRGIQANGPKVYANNTAVVAAVGSGEIDVGFVNHYYLYRFLQEQGESYAARNYHPRGGGRTPW